MQKCVCYHTCKSCRYFQRFQKFSTWNAYNTDRHACLNRNRILAHALSQIHTSKGTVVQVQTCMRKVRGQGKNECGYAKNFLRAPLLITIQDSIYRKNLLVGKH